MEILSASGPRETKDGGIDLDIDIAGLGLIPFHAVENDSEASGRQLYARAAGGEFGQVAPYVEPPAVVNVPQSISPRQGKLVLIDADLYDDVEAHIASLTGIEGKKAKVNWEAATEFRRDDPLLNGIAAAQGLTSEQIDQLFISGALL